jgi:uncharacterized membrane protein YfcA
MDISFALLACFAFLSYLSAVFAGFGGVIIALTLGAHLYPIKWMLPVLLPLTLIANLYIFIRHHKYIDTQILLRQILPFMGTGLVIGFVLFNLLHGELMRTLFGLIVILVAIRELINLIRGSHQNEALLPGWISAGYIFAAGVIHGIYASGGPLLVYAVNKMQLEKSVFRSTLSIVWLIMNILLTASYAVVGKIHLESLKYSAYLLPSLTLGVLLGEFLHQRIPERSFKFAVFMLLMLSGVFITLK